MKSTPVKSVGRLRRALGKALVVSGAVLVSTGVAVGYGSQALPRWEEAMAVAAAYLKAGGGPRGA